MVTLEAAMGTAVVLLLVLLLFHVLAFGRDLLLVQEAARAGARVAATTTSDDAVVRLARDAADGMPVHVSISPPDRRAGDVVTVEVRWTSTVGPFSPTVRAHAVARVEPAVGP